MLNQTQFNPEHFNIEFIFHQICALKLSHEKDTYFHTRSYNSKVLNVSEYLRILILKSYARFPETTLRNALKISEFVNIAISDRRN